MGAEKEEPKNWLALLLDLSDGFSAEEVDDIIQAFDPDKDAALLKSVENNMERVKKYFAAVLSRSRKRKIPDLDYTWEIANLLAQPFQEQVEDSVDGLRKMLALPLPTRLPIADITYDRMSSTLKEFFAPCRERPTEKLGYLISYAFLGSTDIRSGSTEATFQVMWDDLTFKPMMEVIVQSGVTGIFINRNKTDPTGTTSEGKRPDMTVTGGELTYFQEEKKGGDLTMELFEKLSSVSPMYMASNTRRFILGVATSGNTIAYYALDRERRQLPVLISGPITVRAPETTVRVLQCTFNALRFAITVENERRQQNLAPGLVLGLRNEARHGNILRVIKFYPAYVMKTITPFSAHEACGLTRLDYVKMAYAECKGWGRAWSRKPPVCDRRNTYKVEVVPVGRVQHPQNEHELKLAIRSVLGGLQELHGMGLVHRDIRWPNVLYCEVGWFLMDFETVWPTNEIPKCVPLAGWGPGMPMRDGCYTQECDLWLVGKLCESVDFATTPSFTDFKNRLLTLTSESELAVKDVLEHEWLQF